MRLQSTFGTSFTPVEERKEVFVLKDSSMTKDPVALEAYRSKWSTGNHNLARTYIGAAPFKKMEQK